MRSLLNDEYFMFRALAEAQQAFEIGEVPVGAVAVKGTQIIGRAYNQVETLKDATAHAEILALTQAAAYLNDWRLDDVELFVTKEPCAMCAGACVNARVKRVVFGMADPRSGACGSSDLNVANYPGMLWQVEVKGGVLADECGALIKEFFRRVRERKLNKPS
ncbi:MAG: tRNA adenosine(34) deaminase TadA [Lentisphaeria bacterium]|nr:tRNA adenosine(34) deaminase TadA [Lentisphaeria bacterium]